MIMILCNSYHVPNVFKKIINHDAKFITPHGHSTNYFFGGEGYATNAPNMSTVMGNTRWCVLNTKRQLCIKRNGYEMVHNGLISSKLTFTAQPKMKKSF